MRKHITLIMEGQLSNFQTEATYRVIRPHFLLFKLQLFSFESSNDISNDNKKLPFWEEKQSKIKHLDCVDSCSVSLLFFEEYM